ncbi:MAG: hydantoinase/carbamoylase family amidase [Proteobacteria bacterium]|nr:hydantoinase/carbamoylase family amidase [Pseudomonadota bacterium]
MRIEPDIALAEALFEKLRAASVDEPGLTRDAYGPGEENAHRMVREAARALGLEVANDHAGNSYLTLAGADRGAKALIIASHLDTVPHGGNFDGAAGVLAGLAAVSGLMKAGAKPPRDVVVMATRGEESVWFPSSYIGARMALGTLPPELVDSLRRSDTGRTLAEHIRELGYDPQAVRERRAHLTPKRVGTYIEAHIEQGPVLIERGSPIAVVTGITGAFRHREGRVFGEYAHVGAAPRSHRHDALAAMAEFVAGANRAWEEMEKAGHFLLVTFGVVTTDPAMHAWSKVPGEVHWTLDVRSVSDETLAEMRERLGRLVAAIEQRHGVRFHLGPDTGPKRAPMDEGVQAALKRIAAGLGIPCHAMPSGAGHDAAAFVHAGIPSAMLFIRNRNGSHNPHEAMDIADFAAAARVIAAYAAGDA